MLYRACWGSLLPRLRWKITAHRIRPQTTAPTAKAAIQDPCHSVRVVLPCSVIGLGKPSLVNGLFVQPVRPRTTSTSATVMPVARPARTRRGPGDPVLGEPCPALSVVKARGLPRFCYSVSCKQYRAPTPGLRRPPHVSVILRLRGRT